MKARFVVERSTRWRDGAGARHFLVPMIADYPGVENRPDPVSDVIWEVAQSQIPEEFQFCGMSKDADHPKGLTGTLGIEVQEPMEPTILALGDVVDIEIKIVGRVRLGGRPSVPPRQETE